MVHNVDSFDVIQCHDVVKAISKLTENKTTGVDGVSAEHLKFADDGSSALNVPYSLYGSWDAA